MSALDMPDVPKGQLPPHLEIQRTRVICKSDAPIHKVFNTQVLMHRWESIIACDWIISAIILELK